MALKSVWGIDIGKYSIKAVRLDRKKGDILVGATDIIPYRTLPIFDRDVEWESLVVESLRDLWFRQRIGETPVVVSLTGHQIFNRILEVAVTDPKRLGDLVKHEAKQQIPGDIEEVVWKFQDISEPTAIEHEVALFALRRDVVEGFMEMLTRAGVSPVALTVAPLSVYNFVAFDRPPSTPLVVLDMGSDSTDLLVLEGQRVWIRPLRTAGNDFTQAIRDATGKDLPEAEKLKRQIGRHAKKDVLLKALEPLITDMVAEIQRSLGFYKQQADEGIDFDKILVLGGGTRIPSFTRELSRGLQLEVEALSDIRNLRVDPKTDANLFNANLPVLGSAIGLALQGLDVAPYKINLLPSQYTRSLELDSKKSWVIAAGVCVALAGAIQLGMVKFASGEMQRASNAAESLSDDLRHQSGQLADASDWSAQLAERDYLLSVYKGHADILTILHEINGLLPAENDVNPFSGGADKPSDKVLGARRGFSSLEVTPTKREIKVMVPDPEDPDRTIEKIQQADTFKVSVGIWYHRPPKGRDENKPGQDLKEALTEALGLNVKTDYLDEECVVPEAKDAPGGIPDREKGKFMEGKLTFFRDIVAPAAPVPAEEEE